MQSGWALSPGSRGGGLAGPAARQTQADRIGHGSARREWVRRREQARRRGGPSAAARNIGAGGPSPGARRCGPSDPQHQDAAAGAPRGPWRPGLWGFAKRVTSDEKGPTVDLLYPTSLRPRRGAEGLLAFVGLTAGPRALVRRVGAVRLTFGGGRSRRAVRKGARPWRTRGDAELKGRERVPRR